LGLDDSGLSSFFSANAKDGISSDLVGGSSYLGVASLDGTLNCRDMVTFSIESGVGASIGDPLARIAINARAGPVRYPKAIIPCRLSAVAPVLVS